jgi:hypothetical protein
MEKSRRFVALCRGVVIRLIPREETRFCLYLKVGRREGKGREERRRQRQEDREVGKGGGGGVATFPPRVLVSLVFFVFA